MESDSSSLAAKTIDARRRRKVGRMPGTLVLPRTQPYCLPILRAKRPKSGTGQRRRWMSWRRARGTSGLEGGVVVDSRVGDCRRTRTGPTGAAGGPPTTRASSRAPS